MSNYNDSVHVRNVGEALIVAKQQYLSRLAVRYDRELNSKR